MDTFNKWLTDRLDERSTRMGCIILGMIITLLFAPEAVPLVFSLATGYSIWVMFTED